MRRITPSLLLAACLLAVSLAEAHRRPAADCPAGAAAVVAAACPCEGQPGDDGSLVPWPDQDAYVSCVREAACELRRGRRCLSGEAKRRLVRCAERSTCGRPEAVVCHQPATGGLRVARSAERCEARGGTVTPLTSACDPWPPATSTTSTVPTTSTTEPPPTETTTTTTTSTTLPLESFGNADEYPAGGVVAAGYLLGIPVLVPRPITLTHLAVIAKFDGARVVLALYASNAAGEPELLVTATEPQPVLPGRTELPVAPVALPAGTYWLLGSFDTDTAVGLTTIPGAPVRFVEHVVGDPVPPRLVAPLGYAGQRLNFYVRGY